MLVLSRKPGEKILIGDNVTVTVVAVVGNRVKLALEAPSDVTILRGELIGVRKPEPARAARGEDWEGEPVPTCVVQGAR
jgi:carbon storage regulator